MIRRKHILSLVIAAAAVAALMVAAARVPVAEANSCAAACRAAHSQCRIATKGSPSCDAQLQSCLQGCLSKR